MLHLRVHSVKHEFHVWSILGRHCASSDPKNSLYRSVERGDICRPKNTLGRTGDPVFFRHWVPRLAYDKDRRGAASTYAQDRIAARWGCSAEVENDDIRVVGHDQIEKAGLSANDAEVAGVPGIDRSSRAKTMVVALLILSDLVLKRVSICYS